jgi:hypothetical protein
MAGGHLLSHALLARCRLNEGWPGGTDWDEAEGLWAVSSCPEGSARHLRDGAGAIAGLRSERRRRCGCDARRHKGVFA